MDFVGSWRADQLLGLRSLEVRGRRRPIRRRRSRCLNPRNHSREAGVKRRRIATTFGSTVTINRIPASDETVTSPSTEEVKKRPTTIPRLFKISWVDRAQEIENRHHQEARRRERPEIEFVRSLDRGLGRREGSGWGRLVVMV